MPDFTQKNRHLRVTTAAGEDALLITSLTGREGISQLFQFQLDLIAPLDKPVNFDDVLSGPAVVELEQAEGTRYFNGVINRFSQGKRDDDFIYYHAQLSPHFWFWTKNSQSRIFQHQAVPDILKTVLKGQKVDFQLQGTYEPRDYCVQYRESDFAFASRMMEEEGIFYFFRHTKGEHVLVVSDHPGSHANVPVAHKLIYDELVGGNREEQRIHSWYRMQEVRAGKVTLWDHCFELPHKHLEAEKTIMESVEAGEAAHNLKLHAKELELYDFPGGYAQRFDGVDKGGGDKAGDLQKIFDDNKRTVAIRMQQEAAPAVQFNGGGNCAQMHPGFKFTLERHFDADGDYLLTQVSHNARLGADYRSADSETLDYANSFQCMPLAVPFRPPMLTPRPTVKGSQTAVVVGPPGEEIFTDKYGRIKAQFHWDRAGKNNADSSCWIRVATMWAGRNWGMIHIPRIGQEVVVDFLEGDPDQPIVVGNVYNADQMPPWSLPDNKTQSGIQTRSSPGGSGANCNQIRFEDKAGAEQIHIHAEKNQDIEVENDETHSVGHDRTKTIGNDETVHVKHDRTETVDNNETITIGANRSEKVVVNETIAVGGDRTRTVSGNESVTVTMMRTHMVGINEAITVGAAQEVTVGGFRAVTVGLTQAVTVGSSQTITVGGAQTITVGGAQTESIAKDDTHTIGGGLTETIAKDHGEKVGGSRSATIAKDDSHTIGKKLVINAGEEITIKTGDASIIMKKDGTILIKGKDIKIDGSGAIDVKASKDIKMKGSKIGQN